MLTCSPYCPFPLQQAVLINIGRGDIADEDTIVKAIRYVKLMTLYMTIYATANCTVCWPSGIAQGKVDIEGYSRCVPC